MNKHTRIIAIVSAAGLLALGGYYLLRDGGSAPLAKADGGAKKEASVIRFPAGAAQLEALKIEPAVDAPIPLAEPLNARLAYNENLTARVSSPVAGRVVALPVQAGDRVQAGAVLLSLDSPDLGNAIADAQKADADARRKEQAWSRAKTLFDGEVLPRKDLESAQADLEQARSEASRARRRLANLHVSAGNQGENFALRAPLSGTVVDRQVNLGSEVRPDLQNPLFVISDPKRLWLLIDLPEHLLDKVVPGHAVSIEVDAHASASFTGRIERIAPTLDPATRRIQVRCSVDDPDEQLKPEMYARVTLLADAGKRGLHVPNKAVFTEGVGSYVFVERAPNEFEKRKVELILQGRELAFIKSGIKPGERVVTVGALLLNAELGGVN